jgi:hypothetical protein
MGEWTRTRHSDEQVDVWERTQLVQFVSSAET